MIELEFALLGMFLTFVVGLFNGVGIERVTRLEKAKVAKR